MSGSNVPNEQFLGARLVKEDGTIVNAADLLESIYRAFVVSKNAGIDVQSYPSGAIPFAKTADSVANTAQTLTIAAVAGKSHYITAIEASISGADSVNAITVLLNEDAAGTPATKWKEVIGMYSARGTRVGITLPFPIKLSVGKTADLVIAAGGAAVVTTANLAGYTL